MISLITNKELTAILSELKDYQDYFNDLTRGDLFIWQRRSQTLNFLQKPDNSYAEYPALYLQYYQSQHNDLNIVTKSKIIFDAKELTDIYEGIKNCYS